MRSVRLTIAYFARSGDTCGRGSVSTRGIAYPGGRMRYAILLLALAAALVAQQGTLNDGEDHGDAPFLVDSVMGELSDGSVSIAAMR